MASPGDVLSAVELESLLREVRDRREASAVSVAVRGLVGMGRRRVSEEILAGRPRWSAPAWSGSGDSEITAEQRSLLRQLAAQFLARSRVAPDLGRQLALVSQSIVWGLLYSYDCGGDVPEDGDPREVLEWLAGGGGYWVAGDRDEVVSLLADRVQRSVERWGGMPRTSASLDRSTSPGLGIVRALLVSIESRSSSTTA